MNVTTNYIKKNIDFFLINKNISKIRAGNTLRIYSKVIDSSNKRIQIFEGICISIKKRGISSSLKLRRTSYSTTFEKNFPIYSPLIISIEIISLERTDRSRFYYTKNPLIRSIRAKTSLKKYIV